MQQNLKVLMLNGSPRANGNTSVALKEMEQVFKDNGIETEIKQMDLSLQARYIMRQQMRH